MRRRAALRAAAVGGLASLLAACAPAPVAPTTPTVAPNQKLQLPTDVPFQGPPPDQPGNAQGVQPVYIHDYQAGKFVVYPDGFGAVWNDLWRTGLSMNPPVNFLMIPPFPAFEGGKPAHYLGPGYLGTEMVRKDSPERVKELLRILDWLAAPFGSREDASLTLGVQGVDYSLGANGNPVLTERGNPDANYVPWKYVMQHPQVMYVPDIPGYGKAEYEAEHILMPIGVQNPTLGYFSSALVAQGTVLARALGDGMIEIITGRRPIGDWDQVVKDWQSNGGNQIRTELQQALAARA